ncbi:MAG: cystathionine gamma-synthase [Planctomycetota bacterium]|jgi:cystathionine gamma-lyase|nr:cystathionine gamma-synthase [Planctomycetota bacterium]
MRFGTTAVHAGQSPDPTTGAIMTPLFCSSTYVQEYPAVVKDGYDYSRGKNPTRTALESNLAALEGARHGVAFASGLAAIHAVATAAVSPGDRILCGNDLYGGTLRLFRRLFEPQGIEISVIDTSNLSAVEEALKQAPVSLVWLETPTNPLLRITDLAAVCKLAHEAGARVACDNTFATPYLQNPLALGCDFAVHSATKYLGGHSDVISGAIMLNDDALAEKLHFVQMAVGAVPGPMDCFLVLRGIKTLHIRMERHCANAKRVAEYLAGHARVSKVHYPGLASHAGHEVAARQMSDFGGMISFVLKGSVEDGMKFTTKTKLFALAESLGGVESLIEHPPSMTHASIPAEERRASGLDDGLIRLSVGIEDIDDLIQDLEQAFAQV